MSRIAYIFPGQGAQYSGMGKDFYDTFPESRAVYEAASKLTGLNMEKLCFEENEELNITEYTQAAILTTSYAMLKAWETYGIVPEVCAGLSLGEYNALCACGAMDFTDACKVVRERGILMQSAVPTGLGAMAAILALDEKVIEQVCAEIDGVEIANYNCPGQIVISGKKEAVEAASEACKNAGAKRTVMLNVSGPFHSGMLKTAGEELYQVLEPVTVKEHSIPYVTNVTAEYVTGTTDIKNLLKEQVYSSVMWQQSVERMIENGIDTFIEIGPGKTLTAFVKKINRGVRVYNIEKAEDLEKVSEGLKAEA